MFGTGAYRVDPTEEEKYYWLKGVQNIPNYPKDHKPLVRAWDMNTGREIWTKDFAMFGSGGDEAGLCLMGDTLYYSCFFGYSPGIRRGLLGPAGITAAIDPTTGQVIWLTTKYYIHGGCTISGKNGCLYLGGYNPVGLSRELRMKSGGGRMIDEDTGKTLHTRVWCLDAKDGSLIWESDPLLGAIHVITIDDKFLFTHAQYRNGYLLDKDTGKILKVVSKGYKCTRFNLSKPYLLGTNMDVIDLSDIDNIQLISTGPPLDIAGCIGPVVSNGRMFYTSAGAGMQACQVYGKQAASITSLWKNTSFEAAAP
jgi:outer membrane protein assembly factor BamB